MTTQSNNVIAFPNKEEMAIKNIIDDVDYSFENLIENLHYYGYEEILQDPDTAICLGYMLELLRGIVLTGCDYTNPWEEHIYDLTQVIKDNMVTIES